MQKVGTLPPSSFKTLLTPEELKSAIEQAKSKKAKPWYTIPRAKFLEYIHSMYVLSVDYDFSISQPHCALIDVTVL